MATTFGAKGLVQATPAWAQWIPRWYAVIGASGMVFINAIGVPEHIQVIILRVAVAASPFIILVANMFGVNLVGSVPASDVTAVQSSTTAKK